MDSIDNILAAGSSVQWTTEEAEIDDLEALHGFPQIVKATPATAEKYNLPENEPVMLYGRKNLIRTIAQTVEEGHYVMGKQVEISNEFSGYFRISHDFERDEIPLKKFNSIQEVADFFPPKVFVQEQITATVAGANEGFGRGNHVILHRGDELTLIRKFELPAVLGTANKPASRFITKVRSRPAHHAALVVHCSRLDESLTLPLSTRGNFATRSPLEVAQADRARDMSLAEFIASANYPITVVVTSNRSRSPKDEFVLRQGMHLKFVRAEIHDIILAITPFQRVMEFASTADTFFLPAALSKPQENEKQRNQYQTFLQNTYMAAQLQTSATNMDNYCKSVRYHVPRHLRPTNPIALPANAHQRQSFLANRPTVPPPKPPKGVNAIQLLSQPKEGHKVSTATVRSQHSFRRSLPAPNAFPTQSGGPPLPPRNTRNSAQTKSPRTGTRKVPPVPPKHRSRHSVPTDMPLRAPPPPTGADASNTPLHNGHAHESNESVADVNPDVNPRSDEDIWEEWHPLNSSGKNERSDDQEQKDKSSEKGNDDSQQSQNNNSRVHARSAGRPNSPSFDLGHNQDSVEDTTDVTLASSESTPETFRVPASTDVYADADAESLSLPPIDGLHTASITTGAAVCDDTSTRESMLSEDVDVASQCLSKMSQKRYVSAPVDWRPPDETSQLSIEEVVFSLRYIGLSEDVVQCFSNERIDGLMLAELTEEMLEHDFELCKLYRHKISRFIGGWRPKINTT